MFSEEQRQKILAEARATVAETRSEPRPAVFETGLERWKRQGEEIERGERAARRELRAAEKPQQLAPEQWDGWFLDRLKAHLPTAAVPVIEAIAAGTAGLLDELREQAVEREKLVGKLREELRELRIETAKLGSQLAELNAASKIVDVTPRRDARNVN